MVHNYVKRFAHDHIPWHCLCSVCPWHSTDKAGSLLPAAREKAWSHRTLSTQRYMAVATVLKAPQHLHTLSCSWQQPATPQQVLHCCKPCPAVASVCFWHWNSHSVIAPGISPSKLVVDEKSMGLKNSRGLCVCASSHQHAFATLQGTCCSLGSGSPLAAL